MSAGIAEIAFLTVKRKDGRLYHLLAETKPPEFHYDLPQTACG
jgi:hypothetical protein